MQSTAINVSVFAKARGSCMAISPPTGGNYSTTPLVLSSVNSVAYYLLLNKGIFCEVA